MRNTQQILLEKFDFQVGSGLVFTADKNTDNPIEILALDQAEKFGATAVYFRRFPNSQTSAPQIYIYDSAFSNKELIETHRKLWSSGVVPFFCLVSDSEIKIFSCTQKAERKKNELVVKPLDTLELLADVQDSYDYKKYSAKLFDNGTFWEQEQNQVLLDIKNSPYQTLLEGLLRARKYLEKEKEKLGIINNTTISKLLIMCVLVKYLEEKQDDKGRKLLEIERDLYNQFPDSEQFTDILRNGQSVPFFAYLSKKFNGKIFHLTDTEKEELIQANLTYVAQIFDANIEESGQYVIWKLYSFNHLPIELISGIYEAFLTRDRVDRNDIVYTPPYLVNFLVDECMPIYKAQEFFSDENFKVLDPSCGSGIFLVAALKRMVQWKAILHYNQTGEVKYPDQETIKRIIRNNIFGVDIEQEATLISIFSLSIALCDKLSPMQIWEDLRFDDLSINNIQTKNFFQFFNETPAESFDLVIGNPPFNPPKETKNSSFSKNILLNFGIKPSYPIHDDNLALLFWDTAIQLCKSQKSICLILPSGAWLYNNNALEYRKHFLQTYDVKKVIDFTHLRDILFHGSAKVAVCATIAQNQQPSKENLLHIAIKRSSVAEKRVYFEIDHYDFHKVNYDTALNNQFVWKANLLGIGNRLLRLINRLYNLRSLEEYLEEKKKSNGWEFGEGYQIGSHGTRSEEELLSSGFKKAEWITGKKTVEAKDFNEFGIKTSIETETIFEYPKSRDKEIFSPPHILIKENLGQEKIPIVFSDEYLCFKNEIVGIHSPQSDYPSLQQLFKTLIEKNQIFRFFSISISSRAGINKSHTPIYIKDILGLPYPEDELDLELSQSETIVRDDVLNYLMKSGLDSKNSPLNQLVNENELSEFGEVFCKTLNPIYEKEGMSWQVDSFQKFDNLTAFVFRFGKQSANPIIDLTHGNFTKIETLVYDKTHQNARITRVLRAYLHQDGYDILILIKPNQIRYWLKSIALRDADETFADLKRAGF